MQNTLTLKSSTPTDPPRRSSGSMKAVNEWWTEFGEIPGTTRSGKLLTQERVETSGLIYLQQLRAKSVRPTVHFSAAMPVYAPVMTPEAAPEAMPEAGPEPVVSLPRPNVLMPVLESASARSIGSPSTWLTILASTVLVVSLGLITWQTRKAAPATCPVAAAPPPVAACDSAPPAPAGPIAPAPLGPRTVTAAAPLAPIPTGDTATPVAAAPTRPATGRSRRDRDADEDVAPPAPSVDDADSKSSVYDTLASLRPAAPAPVATPAPAPARVAAPVPREPQTTAEMLKAAAAGKPTAPALAEALPVTLPTAPVLSKLRSRGALVTACMRQYGFLRETIEVRVTLSGTTGRPASVQALGPFAGTPAGKCVERSFGGLVLGRFQSASQSVTLPFVVR